MGETMSDVIDAAGITSVLVSLISVLLPIVIIVMVFKLIGNVFEGLTKTFAWRPKFALRPKRAVAWLGGLALLAAQTTTTAAAGVGDAAAILYSLLPLILTITVIAIVLRLVGKLPDMLR